MEALLAEVDRLTVDFAMFKRDVWRTGIPEAKAAERARIRAAVEGLTQYPGLAFNDPSMRGLFVDYYAVLAAIDGEASAGAREGDPSAGKEVPEAGKDADDPSPHGEEVAHGDGDRNLEAREDDPEQHADEADHDGDDDGEHEAGKHESHS
jgi:hypothetical protein